VVLGRAVCQPEKRKVDSSVLSLTTSFGLVSSALTGADADWALSRLLPPSDHDCPHVTVVGRSLSHVDRTPPFAPPGPTGKTGSGVSQAGPRRAARLRVRGDNTGGAQLPGTGARGGSPGISGVSANTACQGRLR